MTASAGSTRVRPGLRWPIAFALIVALFGATAITPALPIYIREGVPEVAITGAFALYGVIVLLVLVAGGRVLGRVGRRTSLLIGLAFAFVAGVVTLTTDTTVEFFIGRVLIGVAAGIFLGTANAFLLTETPKGSSAGALPAIATTAGLGAGPLVAGAFVQWLPAPTVTIWVVVLALVVIAACSLLLVDDPRPPAGAAGGPSVPSNRRESFIKVGAIGFGGFLAFGIYAAAAPALLGSAFDVTEPAAIGGIVGAFFLAAIAGPAVSKLLPEAAATNVGAAAIVLGLLGVGASILAGSLLFLVGAGVLTGIGQGIAMDSGLGELTDGLSSGASTSITAAYFVVLYVATSLPVVVIGFASLAVPLVAFTAACCLAAGAAVGVVVLLASRSSRTPTRSTTPL